ncbi:MAG: DUF4918 family protein [Saprospiraceae bacterium]|nr:DUF4918 family protein [Saprospiraceae bacterium]MBL0084853.1 DUF4918 family protein [Saprospiraceae bacterium]
MIPTLSTQFFEYLDHLSFDAVLPEGIGLLNPMDGNEMVRKITRQFYNLYYNDHHNRTLILGINPGRLGGGATGIPFTDTKRLKEKCGLELGDLKTHEPSSVFVYEWIDAMGGATTFYQKYLIHSVCPLGFTKGTVNYNYYDDKILEALALPLIKKHLTSLLHMGFRQEVVFCLGTGKNYQFLSKLNESEKYFGRVVPLEHPRFIMQYKSKSKEAYIDQFIDKLNAFS